MGGGRGDQGKHLKTTGILSLMLKTNPPGQSARKNLLGKGGLKVEKDFKPITRLGEGSIPVWKNLPAQRQGVWKTQRILTEISLAKAGREC